MVAFKLHVAKLRGSGLGVAMMDERNIEAPKPKGGDSAHGVAKVALGLVPGVGGPLAEMFSLLVKTPLERRHHEWAVAVSQKINELQSRRADLTPERLANDPRFVTAITKATEAAIRTHEMEKIDALLGAVVSAAEGVDALKEGLYFRFLDVFQAHHLRLLFAIERAEVDLAVDSNTAPEAHDVLEKFRDSELNGDEVVMRLLTEELEAVRSLYEHRVAPGSDGGSGKKYLHLTSLGRSFIEFIRAKA